MKMHGSFIGGKMFKLKIKDIDKDDASELMQFFFGDLLWVFDKDEGTLEGEGDYKIILKIVFYIVTRINPFTRMAFTIVRLADEERGDEE